MSKDWYSPGEVKFNQKTALWLIWSLPTLRSGYWPPEASNYIEFTGKKSGRHRAYFETPVEYAAEISERMQKCGLDGLILLALECWGETEDTIASYFKLPVWTIRKRKKRALAYVASGPARRWHDTSRRKGETYQQFKLRKHYPRT